MQTGFKKEYFRKENPDRLLPSLIKDGLRTRIVAREIHYFLKLGSTNSIAKELACSGSSDGTLVVAEHQTDGRGRLGRQWIATPYRNILSTLIFYPPINPAAVFRLTMIASIAVVRAVREICHINALIKWPNDVYIKGKKVCGILTEFVADHERLAYAIVGIGINVNFDPGDHAEIRDTATSLLRESQTKISRLDLLKALLQEVDTLYQDLLSNDGDNVKIEWERHAMVLARPVKIVSGTEIIEGTAKGIDQDGRLILIDTNGKIKKIVSGDLSLLLDN